jgi:hypothetical protein
MEAFDFFREQYLLENERREHINNAIGIPMAIITAEVTAMFVLATSFDNESVKWCLILFWILFVISAFALIVSAHYLSGVFVSKFPFFNASNSFLYKQVQYPDRLLDWHKDLVSYYQTYGSSTPANNILVDEAFKAGLMQQFADFATVNAKHNDQKGEDLFYSKLTILYSLFFLFMSIFPYGYSFFHKKDKANIVRIVDRVNIEKPMKILNVESDAKSQPTATKSATKKPSKSAASKTTGSDSTTRKVNKRGQGSESKK